MKYVPAGIKGCLCLYILTGCVGDPAVSGVGGQTTNGMTVSVVYPGGKAGGGLPVRVRQADYLAKISGDSQEVQRSCVNGMTDPSGIFTVDSLDSGSYIVEVNDGHGNAVAFEHHTLVTGGIVDVGTGTLTPTGMVRGYLPPDEQNGKDWYVQIYGLERIATVDRLNGAFVFPDVPAGRYIFRRVSVDSTAAALDISDVQVNSNDTTVIPPYPAWRYKAALKLNTAASGADVQGDVLDFPVLLRLTGDNFDFSQAAATGSDIRFTKPDNTFLPYEIERWDPVAGLAEVWVKVDTVYGNNSTQSIIMYWGNADASGSSNGAAVFDTITGFSGVWHLDETGNSTVDGYADATPNAAHGQGTNLAAGNESEAVIGRGQNLQYSSSCYITVKTAAEPKFDITGALTLSAWINVGSWNTAWQTILSKGDNAWRLIRYNQNGFLEFVCDGVADTGGVYYARGSTVLDTGADVPYYVTCVYDGSYMYMFLNGASDATPVAARGSINTNDLDMVIGGNGLVSGRSFNGVIDEVRVEKVARSADWIKLCYMNQRKDDRLVSW